MSNTNFLPTSVSDTLLHEKDSDRTERVILPITRYKNVLNAPQVVTNGNAVKGAPFVLLVTETETLSTSELRKLAGGIV